MCQVVSWTPCFRLGGALSNLLQASSQKFVLNKVHGWKDTIVFGYMNAVLCFPQRYFQEMTFIDNYGFHIQRCSYIPCRHLDLRKAKQTFTPENAWCNFALIHSVRLHEYHSVFSTKGIFMRWLGGSRLCIQRCSHTSRTSGPGDLWNDTKSVAFTQRRPGAISITKLAMFFFNRQNQGISCPEKNAWHINRDQKCMWRS